MIENILFPVDFSPSCVAMAAQVKRVAALFRSRVTLVHVCDLASHNGFELYCRTPQEIAEEHWSIARSKLDRFLVDDFPIAECPRTLRTGEAAAEIAEVAKTGGFDLIVMPTHAGRFRQTLLGSTTAKVLNDAECPVLTSEHAEVIVPRPLDHQQWVCGVGPGPDSERVVRLASKAAVQARANLSLLHATGEGGHAESQDTLERLRSQNVRIVTGPVKAVLIEATQRPCADVLIIGRPPKRDVFGRIRDLTYSLIRDSTVPVLSV